MLLSLINDMSYFNNISPKYNLFKILSKLVILCSVVYRKVKKETIMK